MEIILYFVIGALSTELLGYIWHRWVAHIGILKMLTPYDFLRRRHVQHHEVDYNPDSKGTLLKKSYVKACEVTFNILMVLVLSTLVAFVLLGYLSWTAFFSFVAGSAFFGLLFIAPFHSYYHLTGRALEKKWVYRFRPMKKVFKWLQVCHGAHHYKNCNYFIVLPVDIIFGSYLSPKKFLDEKRNGMRKDELFPGFTGTPSTCKEPLFIK